MIPLNTSKTITVITVTNRPSKTSNVYNNFLRQDYVNKVLIVMGEGESEEWSDIVNKDKRVIYVTPQIPNQSTGLKVKQSLHLSSTDYISIFDDDDYYSSSYLAYMYQSLVTQDSDFVKLRSWDFIDATPFDGFRRESRITGQFWKFDLSKSNVHHELYGYGFTYFFKRQIALSGTFQSEKRKGWDSKFTESLVDLGFKLNTVESIDYIVIKVQHGGNISNQMWGYTFKVNHLPSQEIFEDLKLYLGFESLKDKGGCNVINKHVNHHHLQGKGFSSKKSYQHTYKIDELVTIHYMVSRTKENCCNMCLNTKGCVDIFYQMEGWKGDRDDARVCWFKGMPEWADDGQRNNLRERGYTFKD